MTKKEKYELVIELKEPIGGYWDGGAKQIFIFSIDDIQKNEKGYCARISSWEANFWFHVGAGKKKLMSEKQILTNALKSKSLRKIKSLAKSIKIVKKH